MEVNYNICRLCLLDNAVVNIFGMKKTTVLDMIGRTCRIEIFKDEGLPQKVCLTCLSTLQLCDKFILKCIESDQILKNSKVCKFIEIEQTHFIKDELENEINMFDLSNNQDDEGDMSYDNNNDDICSSDEKIKMEDIIESTTDKNINYKLDCNEKKKQNNENKLSKKCNDLNKDVKLKVKNESGTIVCDLCGKSIKRDNLRNHLQTHSVEKNYCCELCDKKFKVRGNLMKHIKALHRDTRVTCDLCNNVYSSKGYLKTHIAMVHTTERNHKCDACDSKFKNKYLLKLHKRTHTQERPHPCRFCNSTFTLSSSRLDHERLHMGVTPYKCPSCPKSFTQLSNMKSHFKHNHKDIVFSEVYKARRPGCGKGMLNEDLIKPPDTAISC